MSRTISLPEETRFCSTSPFGRHQHRVPTMRPNLLLTLALIAPVAQAATVPNGSFESNTTDGGTTYQTLYVGYTGLPGWQFSTTPYTVLIGTADESYAYKTPFGTWQLDLSGSDNLTGGWVQTDVTGLTPGLQYRLDFAIGVSTHWLAPSGSPSLKVLAGATETTFTAPPTGVIDWFNRGIVFDATTPTMTVRFENTSPVGTGLISVDNVSITAVPEPAEYAAAAGAALVAFGLFRRRNR